MTSPDTPANTPQPPTQDVPDALEQERMVEALLFASATPLSPRALARRLPDGCDIRGALDRLAARYADRGVRLVRVGEGWAFRTAPDLAGLLREEVVESRKLSRAGVETLAIIAYHQPITRAEIEEIRGVSISRGTIDQLLDLGWIRPGRRRQTPGRPATFVVTEGFLDHFGLESAGDLPGLAELRAAGLLDATPPPEGTPLPADDAAETLPAEDAAETLPAEDAAETLPAEDAAETPLAEDAVDDLPAVRAAEDLSAEDAAEDLPAGERAAD